MPLKFLDVAILLPNLFIVDRFLDVGVGFLSYIIDKTHAVLIHWG